jgi:Fe2+ or Zn2+ uptake regulation protein
LHPRFTEKLTSPTETVESPGGELTEQLSSSAPAHGFKVHHQVVEPGGLCAACKIQQSGHAAAPAMHHP